MNSETSSFNGAIVDILLAILMLHDSESHRIFCLPSVRTSHHDESPGGKLIFLEMLLQIVDLDVDL